MLQLFLLLKKCSDCEPQQTFKCTHHQQMFANIRKMQWGGSSNNCEAVIRTTNNWCNSTFISNKFPTTRQALIKIFAMQFVWFFSSVQDSWQRRKIETCQKYRTQRGLITAVELKAVQLWSKIIVCGSEQVQSSWNTLRCLKHTHKYSWKELKLIRKGPFFLWNLLKIWEEHNKKSSWLLIKMVQSD